jgi:hypothetical protein
VDIADGDGLKNDGKKVNFLDFLTASRKFWKNLLGFARKNK